MRSEIIKYLKNHPKVLEIFWKIMGNVFSFMALFVPKNEKLIIFCSFGGRSYSDSPRALYENILQHNEFKDYKFVWAFVNPDKHQVQRASKVKIDTPLFFYQLLRAGVWVSNSGMDRGLNIKRNKLVKIETWHGTPLKKIGGDENNNSMLSKKAIRERQSAPKDKSTIRCAQSEYDREIFSRVFNADINSILLCDLPRNDKLFLYSDNDIKKIRNKLRIPDDKKVILYAPTYREYLSEELGTGVLPISWNKWEQNLGDSYIVLFRAHYAVRDAMNIVDNSFLRDVSEYPEVNDLYAISDILISDYSSCYFDYSLLCKPMFCFAYDYEEYKAKRGLYLDLAETLPCPIDRTENQLLDHLMNINIETASSNTAQFKDRFAPNAGNACEIVIQMLCKKLNIGE